MHTPYSGEIRQDQDHILDLANPEEAIIVASPRYRIRETSAWRAKVAKRRSEHYVYRGIIREWLTSCYSAWSAVEALALCGILRKPYSGDPYNLMARAEELEFPGVRLPARPQAHIPTVSRGEPFEPLEEIQ